MSVEIWFDEREDAEAFAAESPPGSEVRRVGFAGEEDDEDHAWVVLLAEAPAAIVERAEAHGGWIPEPAQEPSPPAPAQPVALPTAPRRIKGTR